MFTGKRIGSIRRVLVYLWFPEHFRVFMTEDEGVRKVTNVITQSAVIGWIQEHAESLGGELLNKTVQELGLNANGGKLVAVNESDIALKAFQVSRRINQIIVETTFI